MRKLAPIFSMAALILARPSAWAEGSEALAATTSNEAVSGALQSTAESAAHPEVLQLSTACFSNAPCALIVSASMAATTGALATAYFQNREEMRREYREAARDARLLLAGHAGKTPILERIFIFERQALGERFDQESASRLTDAQLAAVVIQRSAQLARP